MIDQFLSVKKRVHLNSFLFSQTKLPKAAVYTAARVQGTRPCADAQGFGNIEPRKTAAGAVLLWPLCGVMV